MSIGIYFIFQWAHVLVSVNHLLTVINSAFNFLIYWSFCCGKRRRNYRIQKQSQLLRESTRPKFVRANSGEVAEGENCSYGRTLETTIKDVN